jgi:hypothetical protein
MQHGMTVRDETPSSPMPEDLVSDFRHALERAAKLHGSGAHEDALYREHLAEFLRTSEIYIFS